MANVFRRAADTSHQLAIIFLIIQIYKAKNARGISVKTQELRLLVFLTRYLDLFTTFYSVYNSVFKVFYIVSTAGIIYTIKHKEPYCTLYRFEQDSFPHWKYCVVPCLLLTYLTDNPFRVGILEYLHDFSIYLEPLSILPQLMVLRKYRLIENLTGKFVFFLGLYRCLYILNWIRRHQTEWYFSREWKFWIGACVQTLLYVDFYYQYMIASRCCGFASGNCLGRQSVFNDNDDEEGLVFEVFDQRNVNPESHTTTSAIEPLIRNNEFEETKPEEITITPVS